MPEAVSVSVAKAVEVMLRAATLSQEAVLERSYMDWELELDRADELRIDIVANTVKQKAELAARGSLKYLVTVDIVVRKRLGVEDQDDDTGRIEIDEVDALMLLVQEVHETFAPQRMTGFDAAAYQSTEIAVAPLMPHLHSYRQFTGIVRVTFQANKAL